MNYLMTIIQCDCSLTNKENRWSLAYYQNGVKPKGPQVDEPVLQADLYISHKSFRNSNS